jgi:putative transposase
MRSVAHSSSALGVAAACAALGVPRSSFYREQQPKRFGPRLRRPPRKLTSAEQDQVLATLRSARFVDHAPEEICATLLDEGQYHCSSRTMYRLLEQHQEVRERRNQLSHPSYTKPELLATQPNELWSWDISKLLGPTKWSYFYLYVVIDVFSRYVVGWMVAECESAELAKKLFAETIARQGVQPGQLTTHADNGAAMISLTLAQLFASLGVTKTHSRPHTSNDNPFSEAHFKTLKYMPEFPERFGSLEEAIAFVRDFIAWYNEEHRHSGIGMYTPADVHFGRAAAREQQRAKVLAAAYEAHPERFVHGQPQPAGVPQAVWINPPEQRAAPRPAVAAERTTSSPKAAVDVRDARASALQERASRKAPIASLQEQAPHTPLQGPGAIRTHEAH